MSQTLQAFDNGITPQTVSFPSGDGAVVGLLYLPQDHDPAKRCPAVVVGGSFASVKEQMGGIYAAELAKRGIIALAIDYRNYGQSSGARRQYEDPEGKAADLSAALAFLKARSDVAGTGLLGVCTSAGNVLEAAAIDSSVGAVATVAGMFTEPSLQLMMRGAEGVQAKKDEGRAAMERYAQSGVIEIVKAYDETDQTAANVAPLPYYFDTTRGAVPAWRNEFAVMSYEAMLDFDPVSKAAQVTAPTLIIHSDDSAFPDQAKKAHALLAGPKELYWPEGTHLDFYDQAPQVRDAADHAAEHFRTHLS
jgi:fermentation-respiration switch protein FrsA (DUF1100 family)